MTVSPATPQWAIEVTGLTKSYSNHLALGGINLKVRQGESIVIFGPNGAGKTTLIKTLATIIKPNSGEVLVDGLNLKDRPEDIQRRIGVVTHHTFLYNRLTAYENLDFFAEAYDISDSQKRKKRIMELLELFNLWERRNDKVATFSKGMKQKLAIVQAIVHDPPVLFLDEPTSGLDPESAKEIRDLIRSLSQRRKHTILLCTHRLEDAENLCSRVIIINKGKSVIVGSPEELREKIGGPPIIQIALREVNPSIIEAVKKLPQVTEVSEDTSSSSLKIRVADAKSATPEIVRNIVNARGMILSVNVIRPSLEEAYIRLIKEGSR